MRDFPMARTSRFFLNTALVIAVILYCYCNANAATATVEKKVFGDQAPQGDNPQFYSPPKISGRLLYTFDTSLETNGGITWPWGNYFVIRRFGLPTTGTADIPPDVIISNKVDSNTPAFILQPRFSTNGELVAFKLGDRTSSFSSFSLHIYNLKTQTIEKVDAPFDSIWYWPVSWSSNSRYISYFRGGYLLPLGGGYKPMELWVYDLQKHKSQFVVRHENLFRNTTWTQDNLLLYSLMPDRQELREGKLLASLYSFDPSGNQTEAPIISDAVSPVASPDGKWVAAFSFGIIPSINEIDHPRTENGDKNNINGAQEGENGRGEAYRNKQRSLMLFPRPEGKPVVVNSQADFHRTALMWSVDNLHLYRIVKLYSDDGKEVIVSIYDYALTSKEEKSIVSLTYVNVNGREADETEPLFNPLSVSHDGKFIFYTLIEATGKKKNNVALYDEYLKAIDIQSGEIVTVCRVQESGVDWYDESLPTLGQALVTSIIEGIAL